MHWDVAMWLADSMFVLTNGWAGVPGGSIKSILYDAIQSGLTDSEYETSRMTRTMRWSADFFSWLRILRKKAAWLSYCAYGKLSEPEGTATGFMDMLTLFQHLTRDETGSLHTLAQSCNH